VPGKETNGNRFPFRGRHNQLAEDAGRGGISSTSSGFFRRSPPAEPLGKKQNGCRDDDRDLQGEFQRLFLAIRASVIMKSAIPSVRVTTTDLEIC
jgi:hypothetical protein